MIERKIILPLIIIISLFFQSCEKVERDTYRRYLSEDFLPFSFPNDKHKVGTGLKIKDCIYLGDFIKEEMISGYEKPVFLPNEFIRIPKEERKKIKQKRIEFSEKRSLLIEEGHVKNLASNNRYSSNMDSLIDLEKLYKCKNVQYIRIKGDLWKDKNIRYANDWPKIDFSQFPNLQFVELHGIIPDFIVESIEKCERIEEIYMNACLTFTPKKRKLNWQGINTVPLTEPRLISEFPIPRGKRLSKIHIHNCQVLSLPESVMECPLIEFIANIHVDLEKRKSKDPNELFAISSEYNQECMIGLEHIFKIKSLEGIDIENFLLSTIPISCTNLDKLRYWRMVNTKFTLERNIKGKLKSLEYLFFMNCRMTTFPDFLKESYQLYGLFLINCQIPSQELDLGELKRLNLLDLSFNSFDKEFKLVIDKRIVISYLQDEKTVLPKCEIITNLERKKPAFRIKHENYEELIGSNPTILEKYKLLRTDSKYYKMTQELYYFGYKGLNQFIQFNRYGPFMYDKEETDRKKGISPYKGQSYNWNSPEND